jgi:PAS domain S-box-containing protein
MINDAHLRMAGLSREQDNQESWMRVNHPDNPDNRNSHEGQDPFVDEMEAGKIKQYKIDKRYIHPDGRIVWVAFSRERKLLDHGGFEDLCTVMDITERVQAKEKLKESEERYRSTINDLQVGVMVHAEDTRVVLSNPKICRMLGLTAEQISGKTVNDPMWTFIREDGSKMPAEEYPALRVMSTGKSSSNQTIGIIKPDGTGPTWIRASAVPIFSNNNYLFRILVNFVDITDQKKTEEDLARHQATLESDVRERTKELRQIVNAMAGRENRMADLKLIIKQLCTQLEDAGMTAHDPLAKEIGNSAPEPLDGGINERPA